jgi:hypothetical protein
MDYSGSIILLLMAEILLGVLAYNPEPQGHKDQWVQLVQ